MAPNAILVIGAGELGSAILESIANHPSFDRNTSTLTLLLRPSSIHPTSPEKQAQLRRFEDLGIALTPGDIDHDSLELLTRSFSAYATVIQAAGMTSPSGSMTKITQAVLAAGVSLYIPWQHGVDYDIIGREGGQGLFSEQVGVREMLRTQDKTRWLILSCGIFMSFLFEDFWGVVKRLPSGSFQVTALNSWEDWITATTAADIGKITAELLFKPDAPRDQPVFIAGDTLTYAELAGTLRQETGKEVSEEVWPLAYLKEESRKDPDNKLKKYRVVFSEGRGLSWPKNDTWSARNGIEMEDVATWIRASLC